MKTILEKISCFLRNLFAFLRVTLTLQIGRAKVSKEDKSDKGGQTNDRKSD